MRFLVAGAAATVVVGFALGFALGGRSSSSEGAIDAAAPRSTTTVAEMPATTATSTSTTEAPAPSTTTSTTSTSTTTSTTAPTTSVAPPTSVEPVATTPTTASPPTTATAPVAPSRVVVSHASDGSGRLIIPRNGTANLVISNQGGLAQQWLVTGTGFTTIGPSQGTLAPGQTVTVTLTAPPGELPSGEISGLVTVLGAVNPNVAFVIPPA